MKKLKFAGIGVLILVWIMFFVAGCGNSRVGTSAGVDLVWGPNGPRVQPNLSVGLYGGGRW